MHIRSK